MATFTHIAVSRTRRSTYVLSGPSGTCPSIVAAYNAAARRQVAISAICLSVGLRYSKVLRSSMPRCRRSFCRCQALCGGASIADDLHCLGLLAAGRPGVDGLHGEEGASRPRGELRLGQLQPLRPLREATGTRDVDLRDARRAGAGRYEN